MRRVTVGRTSMSLVIGVDEALFIESRKLVHCAFSIVPSALPTLLDVAQDPPQQPRGDLVAGEVSSPCAVSH
jgi:hypothetical protein